MAGVGDSYWTRKRKTISSGGIKSIYLVGGSYCSQKACRLFEFKIRITTTTTTGKEELGGEESVINKKIEATEGDIIKIHAFYDQFVGDRQHTPHQRIVNFAAVAPLTTKRGAFLLIPNEFSQNDYDHSIYKCDVSRIPALIYNVFSGTSVKFSEFPNEPKSFPFAVSVDGKVYVFSGEPSFQVYDPEANSWTALSTPPFNKVSELAGYAVFKDYIIVSLETIIKRISTATFMSYHTVTGEWKKVKRTSKDLTSYDLWIGPAVVVDDAIYGFSLAQSMVAYPLFENFDHSLSIDSQINVEGALAVSGELPSRAIGKIEDRLLCGIDTYNPPNNTQQPVGISFYHVCGLGRCRIVASFSYNLTADDQFFDAAFLSFLHMLPSGGDGDYNAESGREKRAELCEDYDRAKVSDAEKMESAMDELEPVI